MATLFTSLYPEYVSVPDSGKTASSCRVNACRHAAMNEEWPWKRYPVSSPSQPPHPCPTPSSTCCQPLSCVRLAWIHLLFLPVPCHLSRSPPQQLLFHPASATEMEEAASSHAFLPPFFDSLPSWFSGPLPCVPPWPG